jgi:hypothetical protein
VSSRRAERVRDQARARWSRQSADKPRAATRNYRVVAVSLYTEDAESVDQIAAALAQAGFVRASRSFVIQAAIRRLQGELGGKAGRDLIQFFLDSPGRRPLARIDPGRRPDSESSRP